MNEGETTTNLEKRIIASNLRNLADKMDRGEVVAESMVSTSHEAYVKYRPAEPVMITLRVVVPDATTKNVNTVINSALADLGKVGVAAMVNAQYAKNDYAGAVRSLENEAKDLPIKQWLK